ncbi:hypothetical protein ABW21_db0201076 [Orbilia brochopaga]|nr:hypothetical protein ABW21_db0201076 [Drechslerella brochopaga]
MSDSVLSRSHRVTIVDGRHLRIEFSPAYARRLRDLEEPCRMKRKYDRQPETEAMKRLREIAAKTLHTRLGLVIEPKAVYLSARPFPRKKTTYTWRLEDGASSEDRKLFNVTFNSTSNYYRWFYRWSDPRRDSLASLIGNGFIVPELYNERSSVQGTGLATINEPQAYSDSDGEDDNSMDGDYQLGDEPSAISEGLRFGKRRRLQTSLHTEDPIDGSENPTTSDITTSSELECQVNEPLNGFPSPGCPEMELRSRTHSPESSRACDAPSQSTSGQSGPPRRGPCLTALKTAGIVDLESFSVRVPTVRNWSSTSAPVAPSPFALPTPTEPPNIDPVETDLSHPSHSPVPSAHSTLSAIENMDLESDEDEAARKATVECIKDMQACMRGFTDHATVGYLQTLRQRKEIRSLKRTITELQNTIEDQEVHLRSLQQDNANYASVNKALADRANALEKDRAAVTAERNVLRKSESFLKSDIESLRDGYTLLEQNLEEYATKEARSVKELELLTTENQALVVDKEVLINRVLEGSNKSRSVQEQLRSVTIAREQDVAAWTLREENLKSKNKKLLHRISGLKNFLAQYKEKINDFLPKEDDDDEGDNDLL